MSREPLSQQYLVHKAHKALSRTDRNRVEKTHPSTATLGGSFFTASRKHQRGSMLVMALFIMIVLALLGLTLALSLIHI